MAEERVFRDREQAGRLLAIALEGYRGQDAVVLALPRGGVPVAVPVAEALDAPLEVFLVRKLGAPLHPELGMGAITEGGLRVVDPAVARLVGANAEQIARVVAREEAELARRTACYRAGRPPPEVRGRVVILVDDGVATGGTARAALRDLRRRGPARLVFAAPVSSREARDTLRSECDELICLETPEWFHAIGEWYEDFRQLSDAEVLDGLERARREHAARRGTVGAAPAATALTFRVSGVVLEADVTVPAGARGVVVFAHGSGSSRRSPRNRAVANALVAARFATVLFDLLTPGEEAADAVTGRLRFDVQLLSRRLVGVLDALGRHPELGVLPIALFGASTGAAAALVAAAERDVRAVVARGGRPDLAGDALPRVRAPALLVVGGRDGTVLALNRAALRQLPPSAHLAVVPGATHLFEEPGALEEVARLAVEWLERHLAPEPAPA